MRQGRKGGAFLIKIESSIKSVTTVGNGRTGSSWRADTVLGLSQARSGRRGFPGWSRNAQSGLCWPEEALGQRKAGASSLKVRLTHAQLSRGRALGAPVSHHHSLGL